MPSRWAVKYSGGNAPLPLLSERRPSPEFFAFLPRRLPMRRTLALFGMLLLASTIHADGMFYRLPEDGAFVRFDFHMDMTIGDMQKSAKGKVTLSSVGAEK